MEWIPREVERDDRVCVAVQKDRDGLQISSAEVDKFKRLKAAFTLLKVQATGQYTRFIHFMWAPANKTHRVAHGQ